MATIVINAELVRQLLPMKACIEAMQAAMAATSAGAVSIPPRLIAPLMDKSALLGLMPGFSTELGCYGAKVVSLHASNPAKGLPAIQGFVCLFDHHTGSLLAIVNGAEITGIRTAAASGLATRLLARDDAGSCGIFGTGVQAATHIDAMREVRKLDRVLVWGRNTAKAESFATEQAQRTGLNIRATGDPAEAAACDVLCTVTGAAEPVIKGEWVQPGAHVNLVGAHSLTTREADTDLIVKSAIYVDLMESCRNEGGDIMIPIEEGAITEDQVIGEIGYLLSGDIAGRTDDAQITLYNSLGVTAQDLFAAKHVYENALAAGQGVSLDI